MKRLIKLALVLIVLGVLYLTACEFLVMRAARGRIYAKYDALPARDVGLLLGTSPRLGGGYENPFFKYRINAAAELYRRGKVRHLLVSGDNRRHDYNEPEAMRDALLARGVPAGAITLDYAGLRTLDSDARAKEIFGSDKLTIISQRFHDARALLIADHCGIDAIAFAANDVPLRYSVKTYLRERVARMKVVLDLYVLRTQPRHLGRREPITAASKSARRP